MSAEVFIENLNKRYDGGTKNAVDNVNIHVANGEIVVLLGPSGCGKTTTLRMLAGLEQPTGGNIRVDGEYIFSDTKKIYIPARDRNIGMVFQSYAIWPHMTVSQNVAYPLRQRGFHRRDIQAKVGRALEIVGLESYEARSVAALSGGQMQRVALARALVYEPRILLLDEPLSNLDAKLRLRLRDDLRTIIKDAGLTALYVTHDQAEAVVLGDKIGVMNDGHMMQYSTPSEIYNQPRNLFVSSFTGATNSIEALCVDADKGIVKTEHGETFSVAPMEKIKSGDAVRIVFRPENLSVRSASSEGENTISGVVNKISFHGHQSVYFLDFHGSAIEFVELGTSPRFKLGDRLDLALPSASSWAFLAQ